MYNEFIREGWYKQHVNKAGVKSGKCYECGGQMIWDPNERCAFCEKCGMSR